MSDPAVLMLTSATSGSSNAEGKAFWGEKLVGGVQVLGVLNKNGDEGGAVLEPNQVAEEGPACGASSMVAGESCCIRVGRSTSNNDLVLKVLVT